MSYPLFFRSICQTLVFACCFLFCGDLFAQGNLSVSANAEHAILKKFSGNWTSMSKSVAVEGMPAMECPGTLHSKMLGELWVINEWTGDMGGTNMNALQTVGFDNQKKKFVGTWVDNMMNHMWNYEGTYDESTRTLTLEAEGPNFNGDGTMALYRDVYEFVSDDLIKSNSEIKVDDQWVRFMSGEIRREKSEDGK